MPYLVLFLFLSPSSLSVPLFLLILLMISFSPVDFSPVFPLVPLLYVDVVFPVCLYLPCVTLSWKIKYCYFEFIPSLLVLRFATVGNYDRIPDQNSKRRPFSSFSLVFSPLATAHSSLPAVMLLTPPTSSLAPRRLQYLALAQKGIQSLDLAQRGPRFLSLAQRGLKCSEFIPERTLIPTFSPETAVVPASDLGMATVLASSLRRSPVPTSGLRRASETVISPMDFFFGGGVKVSGRRCQAEG